MAVWSSLRRESSKSASGSNIFWSGANSGDARKLKRGDANFIGLITAQAEGQIVLEMRKQRDVVSACARHYDGHAALPLGGVQLHRTAPACPGGSTKMLRWNACGGDEADMAAETPAPRDGAIYIADTVFE